MPGSRVLMVMTEDGEFEGACAESTGTIAAKIRVTILETRDRIGSFLSGTHRLGRVGCGGGYGVPLLLAKVCKCC